MDGSSSTASQGHHANGKQNQAQTIDPPGPSIVKNGPKHRSLTPMRCFRGVLCLVIMLLTAFMMMVYLSPITTFLVRLFSVHYSRKSTCFLFGMWLAMWPFWFEKINRTRFIFSGESVPPKERVLLFANHRTEVDWMYLWDFALRKGRLQCIKYILKKSLMKLPVFSWAFHIIEFIPVERKWEIDEAIIRSRLSELKNPKDPLWLAVFPEGTDYTEKKCIRSQEYAAEHGLPILKNVLLPKTKGFNCCLQELRSSIYAVYDITIAYKHRLPTFLDNVYGIDPFEVHIHIESIQVSDIPASEDEVADWLIERFRLKDKLLSDFSTLGHFPNEGTEGDLSTLKCFANFAAVVSVTSILMYLTLFSSVWFKIFLAFSCAFLTFATYYSIHLPQLIGSPEARIDAKQA
ncbi:probable 1-acyl-sn-glycerol-3-phosphate acyltransferase 5 [Phragmites australis]|uniref:probable 1-acyl-sn-glycerol-3-phosphate acyltransferase 5 n=1 Tax=Phragmites australis TaxID=29695 RepID=UPI002D771CF0|nr:probable 1-acyl-sn-glycerol-3-phosphate acyltransferase 5 [Phragmites australis]XP_062181314.1 probable 1-acyl-sn-glycerol-3-phosphate acyltransferase 5 [Phragmites australis]